MKIPEESPDFEILEDKTSVANLFQKAVNVVLIDLMQKANNKYLYWDKFKYLPRNDGIPSDFAWLLLKHSRRVQKKNISGKDNQGKHFGYWIPDAFLADLHYIDQYAGGQILAEHSDIKEEKERYLFNSLMEESIASSILEGAATTRKKAKQMLRSSQKPKTHTDQMIFNNYVTVKNIKNFIQEPLTPELIKKIQSLITEKTLEDAEASGRFKKQGEENQVMDNEGHVLHTPCPVDEIEDRVLALCDYINSEDKNRFEHPVVKAIILHYWLAYIHPFVDGNGRTARALFYWYMLKQGYWMFEFLSISRIILKAPSQYYRAYLYTQLDESDLTYFIQFHLRTLRLAIKDLKIYLERYQNNFVKKQASLRQYPELNKRQQVFIDHALKHPGQIYTIEYYKNYHAVVYQTARVDLLKLVHLEFFEMQKTGKVFYFNPGSDLEEKMMW